MLDSSEATQLHPKAHFRCLAGLHAIDKFEILISSDLGIYFPVFASWMIVLFLLSLYLNKMFAVFRYFYVGFKPMKISCYKVLKPDRLN